jgi:hypothetical protein
VFPDNRDQANKDWNASARTTSITGSQRSTHTDTLPGVAATTTSECQYPRICRQRGDVPHYRPRCQKVQIDLGKHFDMVRNEQGVWEVTTDPIPVGFHYYSSL